MSISLGRSSNINEVWRKQGGITTNIRVSGDIFTSGVGIDDHTIFMAVNPYGKFYKMVVNITTPVVATAFTGVWEYAVGSGNLNSPNWKPLQNVVDGSNNFSVGGVQELSFDEPSDWANKLNPDGNTTWYRWNIRFRVTAVGTITQYPVVANETTCHHNSIIVDSNVTSTYTFEDIYQADVANGWGVVSKKGESQYHFTETLVMYTDTVLITQNEQVSFTKNKPSDITARVMSGEKVDGATKKGTHWLFEMINASFNGFHTVGNSSELYDSSWRVVETDASVDSQGFWGDDGIGSASNTKIADVFLSGWRSFGWTNTSVVMKKVRIADSHVESTGAATIECSFGHHLGIRSHNYNSNQYIHRCDFSACTNAVNPWQLTELNWVHTLVDAKFNTSLGTEYIADWRNHGSDVSNIHTQHVDLVSSVDLTIRNENGNLLEGVSIIIKDKDGVIVNTLTTTAGFATEEVLTITTMSPTAELFTVLNTPHENLNQREIKFLTGSNTNHRSVVLKHTNNDLKLAEPFSIAPSWLNTLAVVPYVVHSILTPSNTTLNASGVLSTVNTRYPFTLEIHAKGYEPVTMVEDLTEPLKGNITLNTMDVTNEI